MQSAVKVTSASKTFSAPQRALSGVGFEVRPGERVALIGASGSGKSTLLRSLCGLERLDADGGSVEIFGQELQRNGRLSAGVRQMRRDVGIVFQQFNLVGRLPVLTNVLTGLAAEMPLWRVLTRTFPADAQARALDVLASVGLQAQAFQRASTLSGGQQQRAAVARVLLQGARLLLADEPVASLDPESTRRVMDLLLELNRTQGMTLIVSLHNVPLARRYCDRAIALRNGMLIHDGPTSDLTPQFLEHLYGSAAHELLAEDGSSPGSAGPAMPIPVHDLAMPEAMAA
ncbi:MAG: phosphonate ABC transporter ATP-binding protein [Pseudomonadota bacterium]